MMPITEEKAPDVLPSGAKKIYVAAFNSAYDGTCDKDDECSSKVAWSAVEKKYKKSGDKWVAKAETFSLVVTKAALDKKHGNAMRWRASASDTAEDSYGGSMSQELYADFLRRIESGEHPPEPYRGEFWDGGMPYLSLSHYPDFGGKAVPGPVETVYVDGEVLKAKGTFNDTRLGRACFNALCADLYGEEQKSDQDKVRISIAFLDWKHRHKKTDFIFERKSIDELCPECLLELFSGESEGIEYLSGHLIHLALTRIPVNKRTLMEVDNSMATKQEDAASIVGEEIAEELEEMNTAVVGKSEALVVLAEDEEEMEDEEKAKDEEEEDSEEKEDEKEEEKEKEVEAEMKSEADEIPVWATELRSMVESLVPESKEEKADHPLDGVIGQFKSDFDSVMLTDLAPDEKLQLLQDSYAAIATEVKSLATSEDEQEVEVSDGTTEVVSELSEAIKELRTQMAVLSQQMSDKGQPKVETQIPARRSIQPDLSMQNLSLTGSPKNTSKTPKLREIINRTTK